MQQTADLSPTIINSLHGEALMLADQVRESLSLSEPGESRSALRGADDRTRVTRAREALRCSTRMMHALAWLLHQRAFFAGDISEFQLRRIGRLPPAQPEDPMLKIARGCLLPPDEVELIERTEAFYARIERLDTAWRGRFAMQPPAIQRLRERIGEALHASAEPVHHS